METKTWTNEIDRAGWPAGEWDNEPEDRIQWKDDATGLPCLVVRNHYGNWCGYVGVSKDHPLFGTDWQHEVTGDLEVHGGITYGSLCAGRICHIVEEGEDDNVWWLGFDCNHAWDTAPGMPRIDYSGPAPDQFYRTLDYAKSECANLAKQLDALGRERGK